MNTGISASSSTTTIPDPANLSVKLFGSAGRGQSPVKNDGESFLEAMRVSGKNPDSAQRTRSRKGAAEPAALPEDEEQQLPTDEEEQPRAQTHLMAALIQLPPEPLSPPLETDPLETEAATVPGAADEQPAETAPVSPWQTEQAEEPGTVAPILEGQHNKEMEPAQQPVRQQVESPPPQTAAAAPQPEDEARMPQATGPIEVSPQRRARTEQVQSDEERDSSCPLENGDDTVEFPPLEQADETRQDKTKNALGQADPREQEDSAKAAEKPLQAEQPVDIAPQRAASADRLQPAAPEQTRSEGVEAGRLFDEMVERITASRQDGVSMMEIQLRPSHLGKVSIQLQLSENGLQARITADDPGVRSAINGQIAQLAESLSDKGIKVAGLDVVYTAVGDGDYDRSPQSGQQQPRQRRDNTAQIGSVAAADAAPAAPRWWETLPEGVADAEISTVEYRA